MKETKNAAISGAALYLRLSKEDGEAGESSSISNQRSLLRQYAANKQIPIYGEYVDDGFSGMHFDRPSFQQMLCDIEQGYVHTVLTKDLSRLGRDYIQTGYYLEKYFPEHRVRYISLLDQIDSGEEGAYGSDVTPFRAVVNDMYAKDISKKIKSVKRDKQQRGLFIGGKAPYGYRMSKTEKNKITVDEPAAEVVRRIFALAAEGKTSSEIARWLNARHIPTPLQYAGLQPAATWENYRGTWQAERISFILKNEVYIGNMVQGRVQKASYKSKKILKKPMEQWTVVEGTHEAVIDRKTFYTVQRILQQRTKTRVRKYDYLLKGLIVCQNCGTKISAVPRKLKEGETLYLACRSYQRREGAAPCSHHMIREEQLRGLVVDCIKKLAEQCFDWKAYAEQVIQSTIYQQTGNKEQQMAVKLQQIEAFLEQLYADRVEGILDVEDFKRIYREKKAEKKQLEQCRMACNLQPKQWTPQEMIDCFWKSVETEKGFWFSVLERIEVTPEQNLHLYFRFRKPHFCS